MKPENRPTAPQIQLPKQPPRDPRFRSLRWRILTPLTLILMGVLMGGAYVLGGQLVGTGLASAEAELIALSQTANTNAREFGDGQRRAAQTLAFVGGVPEALAIGDGFALQDLVEPYAAAQDLDFVVLADLNAREIIGLQRVATGAGLDYAVVNNSDLAGVGAVQAVLGGANEAESIIMLERRPLLVSAVRVVKAGTPVGVLVVGTDVTRTLNALLEGQSARLTLFGPNQIVLGSTWRQSDLPTLSLALYEATLKTPDQATLERLTFDNSSFYAAYRPFSIGATPLGVLAVYQPEAAVGGVLKRQAGRLLGLFFALAVAMVFLAGYFLLARPLQRLAHIRQTADKLSAGEQARTGMKAQDEIGEVGVALDRYAESARLQVRQIQSELQQERRQIAHLNAIFESLPDGIVVQDAEGRVVTMNAAARRLLGVRGDSALAGQLRAWSATLQYKLGTLLAPGLLALQQGTDLKLGERTVRVNAVAVQSVAQQVVGTILSLRDVTDDLRQEAQREALIDNIAQDVNVSLAGRAQAAALMAATRQNAGGEALADLAREITRDVRAVQELISEYREMTLLQTGDLQARAPQALDVSDLLSDLAEEWSPMARAAGVGLEVDLPDEERLRVLGDEKRLLWALGNIIDNAIKYAGGRGTVRVKVSAAPEQSILSFRISDEGVGISAEDQAHLFTRFFRGTPRLPDGTPLIVSGTGQGLYLARKIIEAHGGLISLTSQAGVGTQVTLSLPLTAGVALPLAAPAHSIWDEATSLEGLPRA